VAPGDYAGQAVRCLENMVIALRAAGATLEDVVRLATTVAAGGRLLDESEDHWRVADPEGNEMVIVSEP